MSRIHLFGVRHHGPGCARSLVQALDALAPQCVLVEGPPECDELLWAVTAEGMTPPVALLGYSVDEPQRALYFPFAEFSPEWQALSWAQRHSVPARFIDLPLAHKLALDKEDEREQQASRVDADPPPASAAPPPETATALDDDAVPATPSPDDLARSDPLHWLAQAAGYSDGEAWWNHMVEERGDGSALFDAIAEAMSLLRGEWEQRFGGETHPARQRREMLREAHMRQALRAARKEGFDRIAVVCGAWHLAALAPLAERDTPAKSDAVLLKGLPKLKVQCTWVPWTYRHLTYASGYGAGIVSPGWYEHLWRSGADAQARSIGWLARIAALMRKRDLDCSSASLIEATRLADTLAALRQRPAPGLDELQEATLTVLTGGDDTVLRFVGEALVVGDRLGTVPASVPTVPLQRDLEAQQKSLRLKPEASERTVDLDLRNETDLARSHLLHRLNMLGLPWGEVRDVGRSARGTFHEVWQLQWRPEYVIALIEASRWGQTVEQAAGAVAIDQSAKATDLATLAALVDRVLLAQLAGAVAAVTNALSQRAATTTDASQLLRALPPLANAFRYGSVRRTDAALLAQVLDGLITRAALGLPLACVALDETAAAALRELLLAAHRAVSLRADEAQTAVWRQALAHVATQSGSNALLQGLATRLLVDEACWPMADASAALALHTSAGAPPAQAAAWLDGFINGSAAVLLHDRAFWSLIDDWLGAMSDEHFLAVLPLVRRTFSTFSSSERRQLGERAARGATPAAAAAAAAGADWDAAAAQRTVPLLRAIYGART